MFGKRGEGVKSPWRATFAHTSTFWCSSCLRQTDTRERKKRGGRAGTQSRLLICCALVFPGGLHTSPHPPPAQYLQVLSQKLGYGFWSLMTSLVSWNSRHCYISLLYNWTLLTQQCFASVLHGFWQAGLPVPLLSTTLCYFGCQGPVRENGRYWSAQRQHCSRWSHREPDLALPTVSPKWGGRLSEHWFCLLLVWPAIQ